MLGVSLLGCVLILPAFFASAVAGELDFEAENLFANTVQIPLNYSDHYQPVCHGISRSLSPASQVFYPGAVFVFTFRTTALTYVDPQAPLNSRKTSHFGSTRVHRYLRAPCGLAQQRTLAPSFVIGYTPFTGLPVWMSS